MFLEMQKEPKEPISAYSSAETAHSRQWHLSILVICLAAPAPPALLRR